MLRTGALLVMGLLVFAVPKGFCQEILDPSTLRVLLIGNSVYQNLPRCSTSTNNIAVLRNIFALMAGTPPVVVADADEMHLAAAIDQFKNSLHPKDVALVYYSGYAVQNDRDNYLIPIDFPAEGGDVDSQAFSLGRIESDLATAESRILIMEASRENVILAGKFRQPGLSITQDFSSGTLVAFAAGAGKLAPPGNGQTDLFTQTLAEKLQDPGLTPFQLFDRVRASVNQKTAGNQVPVVIDLLVRDFFLTGAPKITVAPIPAGEIRSNPQDHQQYVWIPAGSYQMGCVGEKECKDDEKPRHKVTISKGFWMGWTEVEVSTYKAYAKINQFPMPKAPQAFNKGWNDESHPMVRVTWEEADTFCKSAGGRLPTEAEWEYAARSGVDDHKYAWGDTLTHEKANYTGTGGHDIWPATAPVRKFDKSPWNLYDMSGNVWEWCSDWYNADYYQQRVEMDPQGPSASGKDHEHVKRGGAYASAENELRLSYRAHWKGIDNNTGFRCVVENLAK